MVEIREIIHTDIPLMYPWECDKKLQELVGIERERSYTEFEKAYLMYFNNRNKDLYLYGILSDGQLVGRLELLVEEQSPDKAYLGMLIGEEKNRKSGIGSAALNEFIKTIQKERDLKKVIIEVYVENEPSIKFFMKNGFEKTGATIVETYRGEQKCLHELIKRM